VLCLTAAPALARPKLDVVVVRNGDVLHGEIYSLRYGQLRLKTDSMGSVYFEWPDVIAVRSPQLFTIETAAGSVMVGSLGAATDSLHVVVQQGAGGSTAVGLTQISRLDQLETGFWNRINGSVSFGFDYERATGIALLRTRFDSQYRNPILLWGLNASADLSSTPESETKESFSAGSNLRMVAGRSRFWLAALSWQRNEELGIASRIQFAAAPGFYTYRSRESELATFLGLNANQEWALESGEGTTSAEGILGAEWRTFRFRTPETSLVTTLMVLPSLTEKDRLRMDFNLTLSVEVIKDLTVDLTYFADADTRPPQGGEKFDTGISMSIGYKF